MPDPVAHYVFGMRVLEALPPHVRAGIHRGVFERALQGPDSWSTSGFYGGKRKQYAIRSSVMHKEKSGAFLEELTRLAREHVDSPAFSLLAGFLCHYCLDYTAHPYIICKGGEWDGTAATEHMRGGHVRLERAIDCYFIRETFGRTPWYFSISRHVLGLKNYPESLRSMLDQAYERVYGWQDGFDLFNKSLRDERYFYALMQDPLGVVHYLLRPLSKGKTNYCIYSFYRRDADSTVTDYMNLHHAPWRHPFDEAVESCASFPELFDEAVLQAVHMICEAYQVVFCGQGTEKALYGNCNYSTGFACDDRRNLVTPRYQPLVYSGKYWNR